MKTNKKRVFIVHGWEGSPEEGWFFWLKTKLEENGFEAFVLRMPNTNNPTISEWVGYLSKEVVLSDENTYFVGHSIGCQTIMRYLSLEKGMIAGGIVLVAPWVIVSGLEGPEEEKIAEPWIKNKIDFLTLKANIKGSVAILSTDDPFVPFEENKKILETNLGSKIIVEKNKGHLSEEHGVMELNTVLESVLFLSK